MTGCTSGGYDQLETSPETIEQELRPAVCERIQTVILMENYSIGDATAVDQLHTRSYTQLNNCSYCMLSHGLVYAISAPSMILLNRSMLQLIS